MPIARGPLGYLPIATTPAIIAGSGRFGTLRTTATASAQNSLRGAPSLGAWHAGSISLAKTQIEAAPVLGAMHAASTLAFTNPLTAAPSFIFIVGSDIFFGPMLSASVQLPGLTAITSVTVALNASFAANLRAFTGSGAVTLVNPLTGAAKLLHLEALSYEINNGTSSGHALFGALTASGGLFYGTQFLPPRNPQWPLDVAVKPRLLTSSFGTGDPVFAPDGINTMLRQINLKFVALTQSEFIAIDAFLSANVNAPFYYILPDEAGPRLWTYSGRTRRALATTWEYDLSLAERPIL